VRPLGSRTRRTTRASRPASRRSRGVPGVAAVDTFRAISIPFRGRSRRSARRSRDARRTQQAAFSRRRRPRRSARTLPGTTGCSSASRSRRVRRRCGRPIALDTPSGPTSISHVAAIYNDYSSDAGVDPRRLAHVHTACFTTTSVNSIAVYARRERISRACARASCAACCRCAIDVETTRELRALVIEIFNRTFAITYALYVISITIAVLGIVSTLFALVLERRREIGLLRYLGLRSATSAAWCFTRPRTSDVLGGLRGSCRDAARAAVDLRHQPPSLRLAHRIARAVGLSGRNVRARQSSRPFVAGIYPAASRRGFAPPMRCAANDARFASRTMLLRSPSRAAADCAPLRAWHGRRSGANGRWVRERAGAVAFVFPRDHGAHFGFATEWWYYTGHLRARGRAAVRLRADVLSHRACGRVIRRRSRAVEQLARQSRSIRRTFALTDEIAGKRFVHTTERFAREALGGTRRRRERLDVAPATGTLRGTSPIRMHAAARTTRGLDLHADAEKPPAIHGHDGVSLKGRMRIVRVALLFDDAAAHDRNAAPIRWRSNVACTSTVRRGWITSSVRRNCRANQVGWDWFSDPARRPPRDHGLPACAKRTARSRPSRAAR
jgi:predicted secreted hydrolase